jgi:hypothetical protein
MSFLNRYKQFLTELEQIAEEHDELTDTDVRERLHEVINYYFIWGNPIEADFPKRYALFSARGDKKVHAVVKSFITEAVLLAQQEGLEVGEARNNVLENEEAVTENGTGYDEFLGSREETLPPEKPAADEMYTYYNEEE